MKDDTTRAVLAQTTARSMGQAVSISRTKNDFELVIRATKELEWILETQFGAPNGKTVGLHDKISAARIPGSEQPLPEAVTRKMRKLVTIRNSLVHDREVNAIADRQGFVKDWQEVRQRTVRRPWLARSGPCGPSSRRPHAHLGLPSGPDKRAFVPGTRKRLRRSGALPMPCPKVGSPVPQAFCTKQQPTATLQRATGGGCAAGRVTQER